MGIECFHEYEIDKKGCMEKQKNAHLKPEGSTHTHTHTNTHTHTHTQYIVILAIDKLNAQILESSVNLRTGRPPTGCDDIRCCIIKFDLLMMSTTVLETCRGI